MMLRWNARRPGTPITNGLHRDAEGSGDSGLASKAFDEFGIGHGNENTRYVDIVNTPNTWRGISVPVGILDSMIEPPDAETRKAQGARLRRIREGLKLTQDDAADSCGISSSAWSAWELGRNTIKLVALSKAGRRFGFDANYISTGDMSGLRKSLADILLAMPDQPTPKRGRPKANK